MKSSLYLMLLAGAVLGSLGIVSPGDSTAPASLAPNQVMCSRCNGRGTFTCDACNGTGKKGKENCNTCKGRGKYDCTTCNGTGKVNK